MQAAAVQAAQTPLIRQPHQEVDCRGVANPPSLPISQPALGPWPIHRPGRQIRPQPARPRRRNPDVQVGPLVSAEEFERVIGTSRSAGMQAHQRCRAAPGSPAATSRGDTSYRPHHLGGRLNATAVCIGTTRTGNGRGTSLREPRAVVRRRIRRGNPVSVWHSSTPSLRSGWRCAPFRTTGPAVRQVIILRYPTSSSVKDAL